MDEACEYFAAQAANVNRMEKVIPMTGFQDSKVYKYFSSQLCDARRMDKKKVFKAQLDLLDKQHKFIILHSLTGYDYKSQMRSSSILEKLYLIYENLCYTAGVKAVQQYHDEKNVWMDERIKACQQCSGAFSLESSSAELTCVNCGLIEILDGTAFALQKPYNARKRSRTTKKYTFKYSLNKLLKHCKFLPLNAQLSTDQICEANRIFKHIEGQLPDRISYPFVIYKILEKILLEGPQRMIINCIKIPSTHLEHEQRWNNAFRLRH